VKPLRFLRTLRHLTLRQCVARLRHELWLRTRRNIGWHTNDQLHQLSQAHVPLPREALPRLKVLIDLWQRGHVEYVGLSSGNADWAGEGKPKLWRYERHYHHELVALAAKAIEDPEGPWILAGREMQDEWATATPPERGDAWEPYPTARRILSWAEAAALEPAIASVHMASRLAFHLKHLSGRLEHHLRGNHLLANAAALVAGGAMLAGSAGESALKEGAALLEKELRAQTLSDGGFAERTVQYHALVLKDALVALELAGARKTDLRPRIGELLAKMSLWLWRTKRSDDTWPLVNDSSPQAAALAIETLARATRLQLFSPPTASSDIVLSDTGWTFIRDVGCELFFDTGPIGPKEQPGHGHDDSLAYELRWFGLPVVTDSGATTYEIDGVRAFERSAPAHATISVDGTGIDELWASFRVGGRGRVEKVAIQTISDPRLRMVRGKARSYRGFTHERTLVLWPARALLVIDRVRNAAANAVIRSHVPLDPSWSAAEASGALFLLGPGARGLQLHIVRGTLDHVARGSTSPRDGWVGEGFGKPVPRTSVSLRAEENGTCVYAIVAPGVNALKTARGLSLRASGAEIALGLPDLD